MVNTEFEVVDTYLNNYQVYIEDIENSNDHDTIDISSIYFNASSFLQNISINEVVPGDINALDASYGQFYTDLKESNNINNQLKTLASKYEVTEAKLSNEKNTNTYFMLFAWIVIFTFVGAALFLSIIEDKKDMNIFSKTLLGIFSLIVIFYIVKNLKVYIEQNIQ